MKRKKSEEFDHFLELMARFVERMDSSHAPGETYGTGVPVHRAEIHVIKALGDHPGIQVTELARRLGITKGAISQTIARLVAKELVVKAQSAKDGRSFDLKLTKTGRAGYRHHEKIHEDIHTFVRRYLGDDFEARLAEFTRTFSELHEILDAFERRNMKP